MSITRYAGDFIFFDQSHGGTSDKEDSVWASVDAVKRNNVFNLDGKRFGPYDPIAVLAQAEEVAALHYVVTYWGHKFGINIESDMRKDLFTHVQKLSFRFFDNNKTGHLVSRMTNDLLKC